MLILFGCSEVARTLRVKHPLSWWPFAGRESNPHSLFPNLTSFDFPSFTVKDRSRHRSPTPHPLATCCFSSQSPCRPSVRFCDSSTTTSTCACCPDRVIYPSQSGSCCRPRQRRESSIVRVISRGSSPVACEQTTAILAASLPSKAACCSIACGCDLKLPSPPICLPKPRGNLKYSHLLPMDACRRQRQRSPSVGCFCPPRKQTTVDCCTETRRCSPVQRCYSVTHVECCPVCLILPKSGLKAVHGFKGHGGSRVG